MPPLQQLPLSPELTVTVLRIALGADKVVQCLAGEKESPQPGTGAGLGADLDMARALRLAAVLADGTRLVAALRRLSLSRWPQSRFYGAHLLHPAPGTLRLRADMARLDEQLLGAGTGPVVGLQGRRHRAVAGAAHISEAAECLFNLPPFKEKKVRLHPPLLS